MTVPIQVQFVQQTSRNTCVHACLSMVTGLPIEGLVGRFGDKGLSFDEEAVVLTELGILPVPKAGLASDLFPEQGVYLVTVPSLNFPGLNHRVVWMSDPGSGNFILLDPNEGRTDFEAYPRHCIHQNDGPLKGYSEVTLLRVMRGHRGHQRREELYKQRCAAVQVTACS